jgi:hypothetical protein
MTERQIAFWIRDNLSKYIRQAIEDYRKVNPTHIFSEDWLAGIAFREVHNKIAEYADKKLKFDVICSLMKGDYGQRPGEKEKSYHGFSFWQIDIGSFPEFIKAGYWKDPYKSCYKAITVLDNKRKYIQANCPEVKGEALHRAITASYNTGEGRIVRNVLNANKEIEKKNEENKGKRDYKKIELIDIDHYTHNRDYSQFVWHYREIYRNLPAPEKK